MVQSDTRHACQRDWCEVASFVQRAARVTSICSFIIVVASNDYTPFAFLFSVLGIKEDRGSTVVKVLCYKSEGRWFDYRWYLRGWGGPR
jgi:hypothetical protein